MYDIYRKREDCSKFRVLVFLDTDNYDKSNIAWYIDRWHRSDVGIEFVTIDDPAIDTLDPKRYTAFYIVPQQRKFRQEIRRRFKERTGVDLHIEMYSNMKLCVETIMMRKAKLDSEQSLADAIRKSSEKVSQIPDYDFTGIKTEGF